MISPGNNNNCVSCIIPAPPTFLVVEASIEGWAHGLKAQVHLCGCPPGGRRAKQRGTCDPLKSMCRSLIIIISWILRLLANLVQMWSTAVARIPLCILYTCSVVNYPLLVLSCLIGWRVGRCCWWKLYEQHCGNTQASLLRGTNSDLPAHGRLHPRTSETRQSACDFFF